MEQIISTPLSSVSNLVLKENKKTNETFPTGIETSQVRSIPRGTRLIMEKVYEAILDAGYNPIELEGTRTGVFVGLCFKESGELSTRVGYEIYVTRSYFDKKYYFLSK